MKLYELAKEKKIEALTLVEIFKTLNLKVRNHMDELEEDTIFQFNSYLSLSSEYLELLKEMDEKNKFKIENGVLKLNIKTELHSLKSAISSLKSKKKKMAQDKEEVLNKKKANANLIKLSAYTRDGFIAEKTDQNGKVVNTYEGYVPFKNNNDCLDIEVDIETGVIKNWAQYKKELERIFNEEDEEEE